ncbi:MAG: hypothetical protein IJS78_07300, partial [Clostridia bacterium]|nr:hypothetical protein [Clostridia bacterium]
PRRENLLVKSSVSGRRVLPELIFVPARQTPKQVALPTCEGYNEAGAFQLQKFVPRTNFVRTAVSNEFD